MKLVEETLPNQLKIIFLPLLSSPIAALIAFINFGVRFEDEKTQGLATFMANVMLRGSQKYANDLSLGEILDDLGAYFNIEVQKEYSAFYLKVDSQKIVPAAEFLAEIISHPTFNLSEVDREKKLSQSDIDNRAKNPSLVALDNLAKLVYQNHPLSFPGVASKTFIDNLKRDDLVNFYQQYYTGANITLVVVGEEENYKKAVINLKRIFSEIPQGKKNSFSPFAKSTLSPKSNLLDFETDQIYGAFGYPGYERTHSQRLVLELIEALLAKGRANKRFLPLYLARNPALYVAAAGQFLSDFGFFLIQFAAPAVNVKYAYQKIIEEIEKLKKESVTGKELERVKNIYLGSLLLQTSDPIETGFFHGLQYLFNEGKVSSFAEIKKIIEKITSQDILAVANEVLNQEKIFISLVGKDVTKIK